VLIDLGERWEPEPEPDPPNRSLKPLAMVVALLAVLPVTAAAPPPPPALIVLADVSLGPGQELVEFSGEMAVVRDGATVSTYDADGRRRWSASLPRFNGGFFDVDVQRGLVLALTTQPFRTRTVALDLRTGAQVWSFDGWAAIYTDVIVVTSADGRGQAIYDATTRALRWGLSGSLSHLVDDERRTLLALTPEGELHEHDLATGALLRSERIDLPRSEHYGLGGFGDTISIFYDNGQADTANSMIFLDRQSWARRSESGPQWREGLKYDCGPVVCEQDRDEFRVSILEKETERVLWRTERGRGVLSTPAGLLSYALYGTGGDAPQLLDALTGRPVAVLDEWRTVAAFDRSARSAPVLLQHVHETDNSRTYIAGFAPSGLRVLGSVSRVLYQCRYAAWRLACISGDYHLVVLEINSGRW
jgi:PQQ-like domain